MKGWAWILIILILVIVGGFIYYGMTRPAATNGSCSNTTTKTYIKSDSSCIINFACIQGTQGFKDSCGCGCEKISQDNQNQASQNSHDIKISNFAFFPSSITIHPGETITWTNDDSAAHTIVSDSGAEIGSSSLSKGQSYSHTFNTPGTYNYRCSIHPSMKGTVIVQ
jgi:plastocyanin